MEMTAPSSLIAQLVGLESQEDQRPQLSFICGTDVIGAALCTTLGSFYTLLVQQVDCAPARLDMLRPRHASLFASPWESPRREGLRRH